MLLIENPDFYDKLSADCGSLQIACLHPGSVDNDFLAQRLRVWLGGANVGLLPWLDQRAEILRSPFASRPWAKSLLLITFLPVPEPDSPLLQLPRARPGHPAARLAAYTLNEDYHRGGRRILAEISSRLALPEGSFEAAVDSGPLLEKSLAARAGLGVYGLNTLLRTAQWGSQAHLGYLFCARQLPAQIYQPEICPSCDDCQRCRQNCPNQALSPETGLQLKLCRSFLAGEKKGPLSWEEQQLLGGALAGCSSCSTCCPGTNSLPGRDLDIDAEALCQLSSAWLKQRIKGTVLEHIGVSRLKRNAAAALGTKLKPAQRRTMKEKLLQKQNSESLRKTIEAWPT
jgi:epoxyqueuosine reductase QueG